MPEKTLCNLDNRIVAMCQGAGWDYDEQKKLCDHATKATHAFRCMFLRDGERCDSHDAQGFAVKKQIGEIGDDT